jgi:hypothetical protein
MEKYGTAKQATEEKYYGASRFACWITKATGRYSVYVIYNAFPRQEWLRERASMLRCTTGYPRFKNKFQ